MASSPKGHVLDVALQHGRVAELENFDPWLCVQTLLKEQFVLLACVCAIHCDQRKFCVYFS